MEPPVAIFSASDVASVECAPSSLFTLYTLSPGGVRTPLGKYGSSSLYSPFSSSSFSWRVRGERTTHFRPNMERLTRLTSDLTMLAFLHIVTCTLMYACMNECMLHELMHVYTCVSMYAWSQPHACTRVPHTAPATHGDVVCDQRKLLEPLSLARER